MREEEVKKPDDDRCAEPLEDGAQLEHITTNIVR